MSLKARDRREGNKHRPGQVRDAILDVLSARPEGAKLEAIREGVTRLIGETPASSIRSYLQLNTPSVFARMDRAEYVLKDNLSRLLNLEGPTESALRQWQFGRALLIESNCLDWLGSRAANSIHAVVTDPPYGLVEYSAIEQSKMRNGKGGVWRIPPSFDGAKRSPLPRFTILSAAEIETLREFFSVWARQILRVLVPGANVVVASNPLLSYVVSDALARAGLERRGELVRLVMTMRGGDRPKAAHEEFNGVSVMPRSMWEPWLLFRKPLEGRAQDNLRKWKTGGFRRPSDERPFGDVIASSPTRASERILAPHPSLKPQAFLRKLVRGVLPLGEGVVLDPFAGSGSTLAACEAVGYESIGIEKDSRYVSVAVNAVPKLSALRAD
jgi:site-specific DNA-methyltransferase (adenine-specific)